VHDIEYIIHEGKGRKETKEVKKRGRKIRRR